MGRTSRRAFVPLKGESAGERGGYMDFEKFTERARGFIESAQGLALRSNHQQLTPEHILKVLLDDQEGMASSLIQALALPRAPRRADRGAGLRLRRTATSGSGRVTSRACP